MAFQYCSVSIHQSLDFGSLFFYTNRTIFILFINVIKNFLLFVINKFNRCCRVYRGLNYSFYLFIFVFINTLTRFSKFKFKIIYKVFDSIEIRLINVYFFISIVYYTTSKYCKSNFIKYIFRMYLF